MKTNEKNTIHQHDLIVTCESCGIVIRHQIDDENQVEAILNHHICQNKCNPKYISYILIGNVIPEENFSSDIEEHQTNNSSMAAAN